MNKAVQWIKCPRCELNYIQKKDKFCDVCKSEMKAGILEEEKLEDLEEEGLEICPICKVNYIMEGEMMCSTCQEEQSSTGPKDDEPDWRGYVDKADDEDEELDLLPVEEDDLDEELKGAFAKDMENEFDDDDLEDEVDEVGEDDIDDFDDELDDDDFDDDEDDEEDEDDDDDEDFV